jgi:hypothetical protein
MSCCCEKVYRMCDVPVCDGESLVLPVTIDAGGDYTLQLDFLDSMLTETASFIATNTATFSKDLLNEKYTYTGRVVDAAGAVVNFTVDTVEYDCFEFTTIRQRQTALNES